MNKLNLSKTDHENLSFVCYLVTNKKIERFEYIKLLRYFCGFLTDEVDDILKRRKNNMFESNDLENINFCLARIWIMNNLANIIDGKIINPHCDKNAELLLLKHELLLDYLVDLHDEINNNMIIADKHTSNIAIISKHIIKYEIHLRNEQKYAFGSDFASLLMDVYGDIYKDQMIQSKKETTPPDLPIIRSPNEPIEIPTNHPIDTITNKKTKGQRKLEKKQNKKAEKIKYHNLAKEKEMERLIELQNKTLEQQNINVFKPIEEPIETNNQAPTYREEFLNLDDRNDNYSTKGGFRYPQNIDSLSGITENSNNYCNGSWV